jgi:hypothetical protein
MSRMIDRMSEGEWAYEGRSVAISNGRRLLTNKARSFPIVVGDNITEYALENFFKNCWNVPDGMPPVDLKDIPNAAPIFKECWVETTLGVCPVELTMEDGSRKIDHLPYAIGAVMISMDQADAADEVQNRHVKHVVRCANRFPFAKWITNCIVVSEFQKHKMHLAASLAVAIDERGSILGWEYDGDSKYPELSGSFVLWMLLLPISFMHCRNVKTIEIQPNPKLNKKRIKRGKLPLLRYHTLDIAPMRRVLDTEGRVGQTSDIKMGLHICHGHFKHFGPAALSGHPAGIDTKPLFGKHVGMYWWGDVVRGDAQHGVIAKDYQKQGEKVPSNRAIEQAAAMLHSTEKNDDQ